MAKWDEMEEWQKEAQSELVSRVIADFNAGAFSKECLVDLTRTFGMGVKSTKRVERQIGRAITF